MQQNVSSLLYIHHYPTSEQVAGYLLRNTIRDSTIARAISLNLHVSALSVCYNFFYTQKRLPIFGKPFIKKTMVNYVVKSSIECIKIRITAVSNGR